LAHALSLVLAARPTALERRFARVAIDRSAGMRQDRFWRSRARWPCETGQGKLWHGLGPPRRRRMTTVSAAGRLERTRFSRRHGIASIHSRKEVIKTTSGYLATLSPSYASVPRNSPAVLSGSACWDLDQQHVLYEALCQVLVFARSDVLGLQFTKAHFRVKAPAVGGAGVRPVPGVRRVVAGRGRPPQAAARRPALRRSKGSYQRVRK
jgi:hypothetical protein